jgi:hypothetical protein
VRVWAAEIIIQPKSKSYGTQHKCRVETSTPGSAAQRAVAQAFKENARQLKGKRIEHITVKLFNIGEAEKKANEAAADESKEAA